MDLIFLGSFSRIFLRRSFGVSEEISEQESKKSAYGKFVLRGESKSFYQGESWRGKFQVWNCCSDWELRKRGGRDSVSFPLRMNELFEKACQNWKTVSFYKDFARAFSSNKQTAGEVFYSKYYLGNMLKTSTNSLSSPPQVSLHLNFEQWMPRYQILFAKQLANYLCKQFFGWKNERVTSILRTVIAA